MKDAWKTFIDAAKETPRLYFAPITGMLEGARKAQAEMLQPQYKRWRTTEKAPSSMVNKKKK